MLLSLQRTMASKGEDRHITRIEAPNASMVGWNVRLCHAGRTESKFFSDRMFGGKENALIVARIYRDARLNEFGPKNSMCHIGRKTSRNSTGIVGVHRTTCQTKGHYYDYWSAQWPASDRKQCIRKFSIRKYGEEEARRLAIQARREGIKVLREARSHSDVVSIIKLSQKPKRS